MRHKSDEPAGGRDLPAISVVVIGRNEGERLSRCLQSIRDADYPGDRIELIYVDTNSTDDSCARAEILGARVVTIRPPRPSAATGRNAGLKEARHELVHFFDGDTIVNRNWFRKAVATLSDAGVVGVYGRREEIAPHATVYNCWTHHDWYAPPGSVDTCGGDVLFRRESLRQAGGYDPALIAGEERDLCTRLIRNEGTSIVRLDEPMTLHDMGMTRFAQYWRRCVRTGYAYAQVSARYPELGSIRRKCAKNIVHVAAPFAAIGASLGLWAAWPLLLWGAALFVLVGRDAHRCRRRIGTWPGALSYAGHHYLSKLPMVLGHLDYYRRHLLGGPPKRLIEYRGEIRHSDGPRVSPAPSAEGNSNVTPEHAEVDAGG